jgi:chromosome segregation ATPase
MTETVELAGIAAGMAALAELEAQRGPDPTATTDSASTEQRAAQTTDGDAQAQLNQLTDTPAAAGGEATTGQSPAKPEAGKPDTKATDATVETQQQNQARDEKGKFARDAQRRDTSWKALNTEKETFTKERAAFEAEREAWKREREQAEAETSVTPEKYEGYAGQMRQRADHLRAEADRLEAAGKFDEAEAKREDARDAEADIRKATRAAEELRKNPPANVQQRSAKIEAEKREWTIKAAQENPELAKDGSEFQKAVANKLQELQGQSPQMLRDPRSIYFVTKLVAAETAAAGVPGLKEKLGQMEARVKELEALTGPNPAGGVAPNLGEIPLEQRSREDQLAALEQMAGGALAWGR